MMTGPGWFLQRMWWRVPRRHLSEDRLLALALGTTDESARASAAPSHLRTCGWCQNRFNAIAPLLESMRQSADTGFEAVFTPERLGVQRTRIVHRLAQLVGKIEPARVLAFPFSDQPFRPVEFRSGHWLAAAAAAGLLLGVSLGQLIHLHPVATETESAAAFDGPTGTLDTTATAELRSPDGGSRDQAPPITLEEFERLLAEDESLDLALTSFPVSELESIDALTPRVRDLAINIW